jgi:hypothetical protein
MAKKWIKGAIKHPGALRSTAKRTGMVKGNETLSESDLDRLSAKAERTGNTKLAKRVNLARTLRKMKGKRSK